MAADSSHKVIMETTVLSLFFGCFYLILFVPAGNEIMHESFEEFEVRPDQSTDCRVRCH